MQTVDDYLNEVSRVIRENFSSTDPTGSMTAATVGYLVKQRIIGCDHTKFGFLKFKDVLQQLEQQGFLRIGANSKNALSIWLLQQPGQSAQAAPARAPIGFRPLHKAVWLAFVTAMPNGRRFFNRATGEVKLDAQSSLETDPSWVEIVPLNGDSEGKIAFDFLKQNGVDNADILASLKSDRWYIDFPKTLAAHSAILATAWKRYRSRHVIGIVKEWCQKNGLDERLLFGEFPPRQSLPQVQPTVSGNQLKSVLLAALERMSVDELMNLRMPARYLVTVLRPDLVG